VTVVHVEQCQGEMSTFRNKKNKAYKEGAANAYGGSEVQSIDAQVIFLCGSGTYLCKGQRCMVYV
jgi:hypothetical protein